MLCELLRCLNNSVLSGADFTQAIGQIEVSATNTDITEFVVRISVQDGIASEQVWALVLDWLIEQLKDAFMPSRQMQRLLRSQLRGIDATVKTVVRKEIAPYLGLLGMTKCELS
jgi:uncharacterized Zn finger protein